MSRWGIRYGERERERGSGGEEEEKGRGGEEEGGGRGEKILRRESACETEQTRGCPIPL